MDKSILSIRFTKLTDNMIRFFYGTEETLSDVIDITKVTKIVRFIPPVFTVINCLNKMLFLPHPVSLCGWLEACRVLILLCFGVIRAQGGCKLMQEGGRWGKVSFNKEKQLVGVENGNLLKGNERKFFISKRFIDP